MARTDPPRRLIVNADDFGRSPEINEAVRQAHLEGILTSASLMVSEPAATEAVAWSRAHPTLGVGLHLVLVAGRATSPPHHIPDLADPSGAFPDAAVRTGWRLFFRRRLRAQLDQEIRAQLQRFAATGLPLDHVNGHLNFHLHPTVFRLLLPLAARQRAAGLRWTRDPFRLNAHLSSGHWAYRLTHAIIFHLLTAWARPQLERARLPYTPRVFGLLQNARVDEPFLARLLPRLPPGDAELYAHPSLTRFRHELDALLSPRIRALLTREHIQLIRYQDL